MEVAMDERVSGEEGLRLVQRLEPLHLAFSSPCRSMRVLGAIVEIPALSVLDPGEQVALGHAVTSQLVGHDDPWHVVQAFQQAPEETLSGVGIAAFLNQDVEHNAVLVNGTPEIVLNALEPDEHFIHVPLVAGSRSPATQAIGKGLAEFPAPAPNCLIRHDYATLCQKQLDVA